VGDVFPSQATLHSIRCLLIKHFDLNLKDLIYLGKVKAYLWNIVWLRNQRFFLWI